MSEFVWTPKHTAIIFILLCHCVLLGIGTVVLSAEPEIILQAGQNGRIPCGLDTNVQTVTWKWGQTYEEANDLISRENVTGTTFEFEETTPYDIDEDNTLIIKDVSKEDRGWYFCQVTDSQNSTSFMGHAVLGK